MTAFSVIPPIAWLILSGVFFAGAEFMSKEFALSPSWTYAAGAIILYAICALVWLPAIYQKHDLSTTGALWSVIALLTTVSIGIIMFGERPSTPGIIGIAFGIIAVFLLSLA